MHPLNESGTIILEKVVNYFTTMFPNEVRFCPRSVEITLTPVLVYGITETLINMLK